MESLLGLPVQDKYYGLDLKNVPLNHAYVVINSTTEDVGVYTLADNCYNCPFKREQHVHANEFRSWLVDISVPKTWRMLNHGTHEILPSNARSGLLCEMRPTLGEFGVYRLDPGRCDAKEMVAPVNSYMPLLLFTALVLVLYIIYGFIKFLKRKSGQSDIVLKIDTEKTLQLDTVQVFRGIVMSLLIFATVGGGGYPIFTEQLGGLTVADILFFMYTWSIGVYAPIFAENERKLGKSKCCVIKEILLRAIVLTLLGTLIDSTIQSTTNPVSLWWPLQRLGVAYFVVVTSYVLTVQNFEINSKRFICKVAENLISLLWCWIFAGFLLVIIIGLISTFISFNCTAHMDPKNLHLDHSGLTMAAPQNCNNAFTESVNVLFVGSTQRFININFYFGLSKGLLGVMSTILMTMIGLKTGFIFVRYNSDYERVKLWLTWATIFAIGGGIFIWVSYPLKFNLWPIASVIAMSLIALYSFILLYTVTEILPFPHLLSKQTGQASIAIFTGHLLFSQSIPFNWNIELTSHIMLLLQNVWTVFLWTMVALILVKKNFKISL